MWFHWPRLYGGKQNHASEAVDALFAMAKNADPVVFAGDSRLEPQRQAKFEHMALWASVFMGGMGPRERQFFVEELVDRLEIGLREANVGDMKIGVHVRTYAAALNGRLQRYMDALAEKTPETLENVAAGHGIAAAVALKVWAIREKGAA